MNATDAFAQSYTEARGKFLAAADAAGLDVESHAHPMLGRDGEALALDVVLDGPRHAAALLIVSSGCHGVEGFCGSAVQVALLHDAAWRAQARSAGVAVLHLHALNPYGFSWWRRTTQENVDLNRNFQDFHRPLPENPAYDELAALLVPPTWPPSDAVNAALARALADRGMRALQEAITRGQYKHPQGLFFGGHDPTWSHVTLRHVVHDHARQCRRLGWIDLHTGLGAPGVGERIHAGPPDAIALARARAWWGAGVTSTDEGSSTSAPLTGQMACVAPEEAPQAEHTGIALEFGTVPIMEVITALRGEQWLENHPEVEDPGLRDAIKRRLRDAFYLDTPAWKQAVLEQALDAARQALAGLRD
jgi:Protein of unknown function (DUF2817)